MGVPCRNGYPRQHNWDIPPPTTATTRLPVPQRPGSSAPGALLVCSQPQWQQPRAQLGTPPHPPHEPTPAPRRQG